MPSLCFASGGSIIQQFSSSGAHKAILELTWLPNRVNPDDWSMAFRAESDVSACVIQKKK
jgi:hypothetical protein